MDIIVLAVRTMTYAIMGRKLLRKNGIHSRISKLDEAKMENGCAYSLEINSTDFLAAAAILRTNHIEYTLISNSGGQHGLS